jgi:hypothetical protein
MSTVGTTILLAVHHENQFFTEVVTRHFQRNTDDSVQLLLVVNDQTAPDVLDLVDYLAQHPRTLVHMSHGAVDRPIGTSLDHALASTIAFREHLLFTHMDLVYLEPRFWLCEALDRGSQMVSGRFVQEPLWYDSHPDPIPRPADDHILINTEFFFANKLVFRSYNRAESAFAEAPWLACALPRFKKSNGESLNGDYPLDPFNLSHLKLAYRFEGQVGKLWSYHFPRQCHLPSVLRVFRGGVRRRTEPSKRHLFVPRSIVPGYHWKSLVRYSVVSSYLFNPLADFVVPVSAIMAERPDDVARCWQELRPAIELFRGLASPFPYRVLGTAADPSFRLHWTDQRQEGNDAL